MATKYKLPADFYALFPSIPTDVLDLIILRKCTSLNVRIAKCNHTMHSVVISVRGCGTFSATDKRMQARAKRSDLKSANKSMKKRYKKIRLLKISQFI